MLFHLYKNGERLYSNEPAFTYTQCLEAIMAMEGKDVTLLHAATSYLIKKLPIPPQDIVTTVTIE
jgi:hypothetical protein